MDDVNGTFGAIERGIEYENGTLKFNAEKVKSDENEPEDRLTMKIIQKVANEIDSMIVMTIDVPSNHEKERVPMLDVQVWINEADGNKVYYSFYEKPTRSPYVISKSSAMPLRKKFECLSQEVFRRLHNTKQEIHNEEMIVIMNKFMLELKMSGYNTADRFQNIQAG